MLKSLQFQLSMLDLQGFLYYPSSFSCFFLKKHLFSFENLEKMRYFNL